MRKIAVSLIVAAMAVAVPNRGICRRSTGRHLLHGRVRWDRVRVGRCPCGRARRQGHTPSTSSTSTSASSARSKGRSGRSRKKFGPVRRLLRTGPNPSFQARLAMQRHGFRPTRHASKSRLGLSPFSSTMPTSRNRTPSGGVSVTTSSTSTCPPTATAEILAAALTVRPK